MSAINNKPSVANVETEAALQSEVEAPATFINEVSILAKGTFSATSVNPGTQPQHRAAGPPAQPALALSVNKGIRLPMARGPPAGTLWDLSLVGPPFLWDGGFPGGDTHRCALLWLLTATLLGTWGLGAPRGPQLSQGSISILDT